MIRRGLRVSLVVVIGFLAVLSAVVVGCSDGDGGGGSSTTSGGSSVSGSPERIVEAFFSALDEGDYTKAASYGFPGETPASPQGLAERTPDWAHTIESMEVASELTGGGISRVEIYLTFNRSVHGYWDQDMGSEGLWTVHLKEYRSTWKIDWFCKGCGL